MQLVWTDQIPRTRHGHGMSPSRAAFRSEQIVPTVAFVEMRRFGKSERCACEYRLPLANQFAFLHRVFLQDNSGEAIISGPMIPQHVEEVLATIVVMKKRRIETAAVEINRIGPIAINARAGDQIVVKISHRCTTRANCAGAAK